MPVLWIDHVTPQDELPGMRKIAQTSLEILNPNDVYLELNQPVCQLPLLPNRTAKRGMCVQRCMHLEALVSAEKNRAFGRTKRIVAKAVSYRICQRPGQPGHRTRSQYDCLSPQHYADLRTVLRST